MVKWRKKNYKRTNNCTYNTAQKTKHEPDVHSGMPEQKLDIPEEQSEAVNRRTADTTVIKDKWAKNYLWNTI